MSEGLTLESVTAIADELRRRTGGPSGIIRRRRRGLGAIEVEG